MENQTYPCVAARARAHAWVIGSLVPTACLLIASAAAGRQTGDPRADSARLYQLDALVVTAERSAAPIELSTSAVSLLGAAELRSMPARTLAEALRRAPGLTFVDFDGLGLDPQVMMRGFYGGGEAEYVLLLVDGRPLNALETGRVPWDLVPLAAIESIEVLRGSGSSAWGDAAMGGVINVITRRDGTRAGRASIAGGQHGVARGSFSLTDEWAGRPASLFANLASAEGSRDHADRRTGSFGATIGLLESDGRTLDFSTLNDWRRYDEPGPLTGDALADERTQSLPFYRFDRVSERYHRASFDGRTVLGASAALTGSLTGEYRHSDRTRTVPLAPTFADTKDRVLSTTRVLGSTQLASSGPLPGRDELMVGIDASIGRITTRYHDFLTGTPEQYADADAQRGDLKASGAGWRQAAAAFIGYSVDATRALRLTTGARVDWLRDSFDVEEPEAVAERSTSHVAFSPRVGLNFHYLNGAGQQGHVYANAARSFKAPTPDQLFDQRTFPVPFPPYEIGSSNDALEPQYGTNFEAGIYHRAAVIPGALAAEVSLAAYHMDIRDELDFDLQTFSYGNIGKSRHRGIEAAIDLRGARPYGAFVRYTLQDATARTGDDDGKYLKAIPRHYIVAGVNAGRQDEGPAASLTASSARRIWLDDANTMTLPDWTRWDARVSWGTRGFTVFADVYNLLDAEYSTTGFPDAAEASIIHYYPAAGRTLHLGVSRAWPADRR